MKKIFIDGSAGTTGLRIVERLESRDDIELIKLSEEKRKDIEARREAINSADIAFLCLPDAAAIEAVSLIDNDKTYEIFTSLSDTQKVCINPLSSCTISGITLNYHSKHINPNNANHLSFVNLMEDNCSEYFIDCYLKGLTNNNNNFNFNF